MNLYAKRTWLLVALLNLVVVAFLGLLLRWIFVAPVADLNFKFLLHAHSHVALLGWLYSAMFIALLTAFLPAELADKETYTWQFWLSQGAVLGMLLSFPVQGYGAVSITFSTAHILLSYWFIYRFLKDTQKARLSKGRHRFSLLFVKAALFFLALSSLGPWAMGPIMALGYSGSVAYFNTIYFYLHFLYNGWFTFAVLGLLFWLLEHYRISFSRKSGKLIFRLMFWACLPAYLLSVLWTKPNAIVYIAGGTAAFAQVLAWGVLLLMLLPVYNQVSALFARSTRGLAILAALAFSLKTVMQLATAFPYMADLAFRLRFFIIGYLHLVLIGFISFFIVTFFAQQGWLSFRYSMSKWGMGLFVLAFIGTEALLFLQGVLFWIGWGAIQYYHQLLLGMSVFLPLGILLFFAAQVRGRSRPLVGCGPKLNPPLQKV
ncbi:hypothetical protein MKJ04_00520 [Pontibacter sp. E15-1]|uniref:hypothetical protein n=1 Tax=Pontibacter sp. E15-1 TaxID=2919918 RepID=UPI001F4F6548|nr:hypothetical protein [Pontibacter sp. E15-1]MCJ8163306.1 hypothetical protein [Pontibacter sp. E15-1]